MINKRQKRYKPPTYYICPFCSETLVLQKDGDTLLCPDSECGTECSLSFSRELRKENLEKKLRGEPYDDDEI